MPAAPWTLCMLLGEHHLSDHPHYSKPFGVAELTFFSICVWITINVKDYTLFIWFSGLLPLAVLVLILPSASFKYLAVLVEPTPACQCRGGQAKLFKPGFIMLLCEATEVLPAFSMGIDPSCADDVKACKAPWSREYNLCIFCLCLIWIICWPTIFFPMLQVDFQEKWKEIKGGVFFLGFFFFLASLSVLCIGNLQQDKLPG